MTSLDPPDFFADFLDDVLCFLGTERERVDREDGRDFGLLLTERLRLIVEVFFGALLELFLTDLDL